jgi:xylulokinase
MFLGIDIGTSSVKSVVVDEDNRVVADAAAPLSVNRPAPGFSEQNPDDWWRATGEAVRSLPGDVRKAVRGVGLSGQMHGATLLDAQDVPLRPAILWNDTRSSAECLDLEAREPHAQAITGNKIMPGLTAPKLLWVEKHEPDVFAATKSVLLPKDYVRLRLTGEKLTDLSDASGTCWLDVGLRTWSDAMLSATHLARSHMPKVVEGCACGHRVRASAAVELGIPQVVVAGGAGDNAATAVGLGVIRPGDAFLSLGTSGVLFVVTDRFRPNPALAVHAYCHCLPGRWHQMAVLLSAASTLDWTAQLIGVPVPALTTALTATAGERGLARGSPYFLPYLSGERTPHDDPRCRGVFFGISHDTGPRDLTMAVLEGVAQAFRDGLDALAATGASIETITVTGGGAAAPCWGELLAASLNRPLTYRTNSERGAAIGAARLGRLAASGDSPEEVCVAPPVARTVYPNEELVSLLADRRRLFQRLYADLRNAFVEYLA